MNKLLSDFREAELEEAMTRICINLDIDSPLDTYEGAKLLYQELESIYG